MASWPGKMLPVSKKGVREVKGTGYRGQKTPRLGSVRADVRLFARPSEVVGALTLSVC